ncbi:uracil-DNA glycosylase [Tamlana nanhaiensis]|uniref:Uracil-DNA glycosylase n=1 Tax=Neotamlana nanhaiensis TaxID=1382798 RepID=A0A0D7W1R2_9FLAO|nr:uracil-DNA glycosylase [Tamlana nanhaiensis]KJD32984.1 uracil-DNA glycosylase [Tamlana nanhaiensis]
MILNIDESWLPYLNHEFNKPYFNDLLDFVKTEYTTKTCYPPEHEIFNAFNACSFSDVKVVIIGQDPYHGYNQANGLCFSVNDGIKHPPSLVNIFKEIEADLGVLYPKSGNLLRWAKQGVLLLNATLTVREHEAGSHQKKGWETFTNAVIKQLSNNKTNLVFLLWGGYAKQKTKLIDVKKHHVLTSGHPSPLSANRGFWFGNKHFSKTNYLLEQASQLPVTW